MRESKLRCAVRWPSAFCFSFGQRIRSSDDHDCRPNLKRIDPPAHQTASATLQVVTERIGFDRSPRNQSAAEIRADLDTLRREMEPRGWRRWAVAGSVILAFMAIASLWFFKKPPQSRMVAPDIKVRQLAVNSADNRVINEVISPDGKYLAYVDLKGIHLQVVDLLAKAHSMPRNLLFKDAVLALAASKFVLARRVPATACRTPRCC